MDTNYINYESILKRMMDRVSQDYPNIDTREGSILFNALAPAAAELAIAYITIANVLGESFVATASREYLLMACNQIGMNTSVFYESFGTHKGEFDVEVSLGSQWNCDVYNYQVIEYIGEENGYHTYKLLCDTSGTAPNKLTGDLTPISEYPNGLTHAKVTECLIEGEDETPDDEIRVAYYEFISASVSDGNVAQYKRWCDEYDGIGNSKIVPLWNGANTVKVSILSSSNRAASEELISELQEYLDPGCSGMGDGVAPIGSIVTVTTATEKPISVSATIKLKKGYTDTSKIKDALTEFFSTIAYEKMVVPYMTLGSTILAVEGVDTINDLNINGGTSDITLGEEEIPTVGELNWSVVEGV